MQDVEEVAREKRDQLYQSIVKSAKFAAHLKVYKQHHTEGQQQLFQLNNNESGNVPMYEAIMKIRWGTQKVIVLKQEEPSWKRRSMKITSPLGNTFGIYSTFEDDGEAEEFNGKSNGLQKSRKKSQEQNDDEDDPDSVEELKKRNQLKRRTMSFSGHMYSTKTSAFRPKYGTSTSLRVNSKQSTMDVIKLLLRKFAVENDANEFNLYSVHPSGESHEFKLTDFPLLRRIEMGPDDEGLAKIFIMERRTEEISLEVAQYLNMQIPVMQAILRKFEEEEERLVDKIRERYIAYKHNLEKKLATYPPPLPPKPKNLLAKYRNRPPLPPKTYKLVRTNNFRPPPLPPKTYLIRTREIQV
ncbi:ras association domain-containing protein 4-like isoform X3 [Apostichopus japonicus]|uniref:ras association domain-containing protein 4-like isoform X3 n=1 Tax=Stichopus japonicus TaxID=307972 RepID=UPI003AB8E5DB